MAAPENLYCGTLKCSENATDRVGYYCAKRGKRPSLSVKIREPTESQISKKFKDGYKIAYIGSGCLSKAHLFKDPTWSGWAQAQPVPVQIQQAQAVPVQIQPPIVTQDNIVNYANPENLYCGLKGCSENENDASIRRYCAGSNGMPFFNQKTATPTESQISSNVRAGYSLKYIAKGCESKAHYSKNPAWEGWDPILKKYNKYLNNNEPEPSILLDSINKCCTTFASLGAVQRLECGSIQPNNPSTSELCKKVTSRATPINSKLSGPGYCISDTNNPSWFILRTENTPGWKSGQKCWATDGTITGYGEKPCYGGPIDVCKKYIDSNGNVIFN